MDYEINGSIENYKMEVSLITPPPHPLCSSEVADAPTHPCWMDGWSLDKR